MPKENEILFTENYRIAKAEIDKRNFIDGWAKAEWLFLLVYHLSMRIDRQSLEDALAGADAQMEPAKMTKTVI
jgi:hypothetical protein